MRHFRRLQKFVFPTNKNELYFVLFSLREIMEKAERNNFISLAGRVNLLKNAPGFSLLAPEMLVEIAALMNE